MGRLNGFPEDNQPVIGKQGPDFSGLGVSPVFKSKGLWSENTGFQHFFSHKADSKEMSEKLVKSWRLNQVGDLRAWAESQGLAPFLSEALHLAL